MKPSPSSIEEEFPPPSYQEVVNGEIEEQKQAITTGPTKYKGDPLYFRIVFLYMFLQAVTKLVIGTLYLEANYSQRGHQSPKDFAWTQCTIIIADSINFWPIGFMTYKQFLTVQMRYTSCGFCNFGFFFFLLDCSILLILAVYFTFNGEDDSCLVIISCTILLLSNFVVFSILMQKDVCTYEPLKKRNEPYYFQKRTEETFFEQKLLTIKESGPFRIVIQNCGNTDWTLPLLIARTVQVKYEDRKGRPRISETGVCFLRENTEPIESGKSLTLIPEMHQEPGSIQIKGFRSFGKEKGDLVLTTLFDNRSLCIVRLTEEFKVDEFRAIQERLKHNIEAGIDSDSD